MFLAKCFLYSSAEILLSFHFWVFVADELCVCVPPGVFSTLDQNKPFIEIFFKFFKRWAMFVITTFRHLCAMTHEVYTVIPRCTTPGVINWLLKSVGRAKATECFLYWQAFYVISLITRKKTVRKKKNSNITKLVLIICRWKWARKEL